MKLTEPYVIVLDDHPLVGRGFAQFLQSVEPALEPVVVSDWDGMQALVAQRGAPRLLVADVWLSDGPCVERLGNWCRRHPETRWLAVSGDDDPALSRLVQAAGAHGFADKRASAEQFGAAIRSVLVGSPWFEPLPAALGAGPTGPRSRPVSAQDLGLTQRQGEILSLVLRGLPNKRIALQLGIAESTVKEHVTGILERLGVRSRVEAITLLRGRHMERT